MKIVHEKSGIILANQAKAARGLEKMKGLMFARDFGGHDGLLISWRNSIHNCFVRFPIDVVFVRGDYVVVKVIRNFRPWRFTRPYLTASHVIELPAGAVPAAVEKGDVLSVSN